MYIRIYICMMDFSESFMIFWAYICIYMYIYMYIYVIPGMYMYVYIYDGFFRVSHDIVDMYIYKCIYM
jgi:hypothetical protein